MQHQGTFDDLRKQALDEARRTVIERLALVSALIWMFGALALYVVVLYPLEAKPPYAMFGGLALLLPAALPWLAYPRLVARAVDERLRRELDR